MATLTFTVPDSEFDDGELAQGTEVRQNRTDIQTFLEGGNLDGANFNTGADIGYTGIHTYTVNNANAHNSNLVVSAVLAAGFYGRRLYSNQAQVNSALDYVESDNASSSAAVRYTKNDGTGAGHEIEQNGNGSASKNTVVGTSNTGSPYEAVQQGTGSPYIATLRTLANLSSVLLSKTGSSTTSIDNTATETVYTPITVSLPANFLKVGSTLRGKVSGNIDTPGAGPATARVRVRYGGVAGTILLDTGALTPDVNLAGSLLDIDFTLVCNSIGATGTIMAQGLTRWNSNTVPASRGMGVAGTGAGNTAAVTVDTTAANDLVVTFQWGSAVSGCTTEIQLGTIEVVK